MDLMDYRRKIIMSSPHLSHAEGAVASFGDGTDLPMESLIVDIEPVQSGSGDPSPSNIRPISGWSAVNVTDFVQNMWDEDWEVGTLDSSGNIKSGDNLIRSKNFCQIIGGRQYYLYSSKSDGGSQNRYYVKICFYDANKAFISGSWENRRVVTAPANAVYFKIHTNSSTVIYGDTYNHDISVNYVSTDHDYHAYAGTSLSISLGQTVYGGTLNVLTGVLTVYPYYASYNGETLTGRWVSDRDKYVAGTTPTNGAQVVDMSGTGTTYTLDPQTVRSLVGQNNIFSDTGNIALDYWAHP